MHKKTQTLFQNNQTSTVIILKTVRFTKKHLYRAFNFLQKQDIFSKSWKRDLKLILREYFSEVSRNYF